MLYYDLETLDRAYLPELRPPGWSGVLDELLLQPTMQTCQHGSGCPKPPTWHFYLGCPYEHVARLDLCDGHAMLLARYAGILSCNGCGSPMRIEIREKIRGEPARIPA